MFNYNYSFDQLRTNNEICEVEMRYFNYNNFINSNMSHYQKYQILIMLFNEGMFLRTKDN
jgi:hypothetical protein